MKFKYLIILSVIIFSCKDKTNEIVEIKTNSVSTFYFVRHAEKDLTTKLNPELTEDGIKRANDLVTYFKDKDLKKVYSSNYKRTIATAIPSANAINTKTIIYDVKTIKAEDFIKNNKGQTVLFVGHSNTIPFFVNDIIGTTTYEEIDERIYNNVFIVTIENNEITHQQIQVN